MKSASVTNFLLHLYWTAAEPMSTAFLGSAREKGEVLCFMESFKYMSFKMMDTGALSSKDPIKGCPP